MNLEEKTQNKFKVTFPDWLDIDSSAIISLNKPRFTNQGWQNITIKFKDYINISTSNRLFRIIHHLKNVLTDDEIFTFTIEQYNPTGEVIEKWFIIVKEIVEINFGDINLYSAENQTISLTIYPLDCILEF